MALMDLVNSLEALAMEPGTTEPEPVPVAERPASPILEGVPLPAAQGPASPDDADDAMDDNQTYDPMDKSYLADLDLFGGRVIEGSPPWISEQLMTRTPYLRFFREPGDEMLHMAFAPLWRVATTQRHLDYLTLLGNRQISFNAKSPHGQWQFLPGPPEFLDILLNYRYGEPDRPDDDPLDGKWLRFQRMPGQQAWLRMEAYDDHTWSVVLSPLTVQNLCLRV